MKIDAGSTNKSVYVYFVDDDGGTAPGEPTTGLLFSDIETGGSASYMRQGGARVDFTLQTLASASAAHADGGFILVDDTNMPGLYRVDVPDAAFAAGVDFFMLQMVAAGANNTLMRPLAVDLGTEAKASVCTETRLAELDAGNLPTDIAAVPTATENADALLNRDMSAVSDTNARSPLNALRFLRNLWAIAGTTLTVKKEDDSTTAWTATVTVDAAADPITGSDPA